MRTSDRTLPCRNCERLYPDEELDRLLWCPSCRQVVIRRANLWARGAGLLAGLATAAWVVLGIGPSARFPFVLWLVLIVAVYYFTMKIIRRVAFEVIRSRGVPPAEA